MGRKKKAANDEVQPEPVEEVILPEAKPVKERERDDSSSEPDLHPKHFDIDPDIQQLAYTFKIDAGLTQKLNNIMMSKRMNTWEQDLERLYEILKDAHTPAAMLNLKVKDMQKGTFVGKAKCGPRVRELARKHRLDKGAATKLEEAMSMREAMGKDVEKDIFLLDEHLTASNKPSALISMKLESLRKGYNVGHCIYSREPVMGNTGPGVDGVVDKKSKHVKVLGYTDADLNSRFASSDGGTEQLMDEATVRRLMAAEKRRVLGSPPPSARGKEAKQAKEAAPRTKTQSSKKSRSRSKKSRSSSSRSRSRKRKRRRKSSSSSSSRSRGRKRSRSSKAPKKQRAGSSDSDSSRPRGKKGKEKEKSREKQKDKAKDKERDKSSRKDKEKPKEKDKSKEKGDKEQEADKDKAKEKDKKAKPKEKVKEKEK
mmetsp:Transcript_32700/g.75651  ORF Transcript_32700/g.75651 Transcript_32700/m.75651 type:complete len:426 (-) Transcript_32700:131-1408(-)